MRADILALRSAQRYSIPTGLGCLMCGREDIGAADEICGRCRRELCPTPMDVVLDVLELSPRAFAEETGLPVRTVIRATKGMRLSKRNAARFAKVTGMRPEVFRP
jgi:hypothetical protein